MKFTEAQEKMLFEAIRDYRVDCEENVNIKNDLLVKLRCMLIKRKEQDK